MAENTGVITRTRRENLCKITSGAIDAIPYVTHVALGDGGVDGSGEPLVPGEAQTQLNHEIARYPIDKVEYPGAAAARYTVTVPQGDLAGAKISEAALVNSDGALDVIKNMYPKQKDDGVIFTFTIDDEF